MNIFGFEIGSKVQLPIVPASTDRALVRDEGSTVRPELRGVTIPENKMPSKITPVKPQVLHYGAKKGKGRGQFTQPEYDLAIIGRVEDTDSYVAQAHIKKAGLLFKEGYEFVGPNPKTIQYIKLRFQQIARASGIPTDELLKSIGSGLVKKSNVFLLKVRKESASGGRRRTLPGTTKEVEPIAAYFVIPAETMRCDVDEFGRVREWKQEMPNGDYKKFKPEDIVHFTFNKKEGMIFGTPMLIPVLDDVRSLRRIEENIEMLVYQHLFPLFHYKVGTDEFPAGVDELGQDEIEVARREIQYMPSEGGIVTSHRHQISLIGTENRALRAEGYLEHFKKRVFSGLGVSAVDMGEGECFDEHTMTLTENGWKFHWQIDHSKEKIATYNPVSRKIEFHIPNHKYEGFYQGKMIHFKNNYVDVMVTPEHEMWAWSEHDYHWKKIKAKDILADKSGKSYMFLESSPYQELEDVYYPEEISDMAALAGYTAALGVHDPVNGRIFLNERKRIGFEPIISLLNNLCIPWNVETNKLGDPVITFKDNVHDGFFARALNSEHKERMDFLKYLPLRDRKLFVSAFMNATCIRSKANNKDIDRTHELVSRVNTTKEKDLYQEMILSAGYTVTISRKADDTGEYYHLAINLRERSGGKGRWVIPSRDAKEVDYAGIIYCYNVPNHLFVTRRNNSVTIQGNTANRATSDNMSRNLVDSVKDLQRHIEAQFTDFVINELLLESTFGPEVLNEENRVFLKFNEIDLDYQIKKANHLADQFSKNVISHHEARIGQGRQPMSIPSPEEIEDINIAEKYPEWYATYFKLIEEPKALMQAIDEPYSSAAKSLTYSRSAELTSGDNEEAAEEQKAYEIELEKEKGNAKVAIAKLKPKPITTKKKDNFVRQRFDDLANDAILLASQERVDMSWLQQVAAVTETTMINDLRSRSMAAFSSGYRLQNSNVDQQIDATIRSRSRIESRINFYVHRLIRNTVEALQRQRIDELEKNDRIQKVKAVFDSLRYRADFIHDVEIRKAYNLGMLEAARDLGYTSWSVVVDNDSCGTCKFAATMTYPLDDTISLDDIPPLHANSRTEIRFSR